MRTEQRIQMYLLLVMKKYTRSWSNLLFETFCIKLFKTFDTMVSCSAIQWDSSFYCAWLSTWRSHSCSIHRAGFVYSCFRAHLDACSIYCREELECVLGGHWETSVRFHYMSWTKNTQIKWQIRSARIWTSKVFLISSQLSTLMYSIITRYVAFFVLLDKRSVIFLFSIWRSFFSCSYCSCTPFRCLHWQRCHWLSWQLVWRMNLNNDANIKPP